MNARAGLWVGLALAAASTLLVVAVVTRTRRAPSDTFEVARADLTLDAPKLYSVPRVSADGGSSADGVWVVLRSDGGAQAFVARDPFDSCADQWRPDFRFEGRVGVFRDPCHGATYDAAGNLIGAPTGTTGGAQDAAAAPLLRGLDGYDVEARSGTVLKIDLARVRLGSCGPQAAGGTECSRPSAPVYRSGLPRPVLFGLISPTANVR